MMPQGFEAEDALHATCRYAADDRLRLGSSMSTSVLPQKMSAAEATNQQSSPCSSTGPNHDVSDLSGMLLDAVGVYSLGPLPAARDHRRGVLPPVPLPSRYLGGW